MGWVHAYNPSTQRQRKKDLKFKASLNYVTSTSARRVTLARFYLKTTKSLTPEVA